MTTLIVEIPEGGNVKAVESFLKAMKYPFRKPKAKKEKSYNPEFVAKILESKRQYEEGNFVVIKTEDLWR